MFNLFQNWIFLSLLSGVALATSAVLSKKHIARLDEYMIAWGIAFFSLPLIWLSLFFTGIPETDRTFWVSTLLIVPIEVCIAMLKNKGLKISPVSIIIPFGSVTPLFVAVFGFIILGEKLSYSYTLALILFILGTYILSLDMEKLKDIFSPFKRIARERGVVYAIIAAFLIGITSAVAKKAISHGSTELFSAVFFTSVAIVLSPILFKKSKIGFKGIPGNVVILSILGVLNSIFFLSAWTAARYGPVGMMSALVSGSSILLTIVFAGAFLKEQGILHRLIATAIMFCGTLLVIFS